MEMMVLHVTVFVLLFLVKIYRIRGSQKIRRKYPVHEHT